MIVRNAHQYTVFLEHKVGALAKVVCQLKSENINIIAASGSASSDGGVLRIVVERENDYLNTVLKNMGLYPVKTPVIIITINKKSPLDLEKVLSSLAKTDINLQSIYWSDNSNNENISIALIPDRFQEATTFLEEL